MSVFRGSTGVSKIYRGSSEIAAVYRGTTKVYPAEPTSFVPNPDFTTFTDYLNLTSGNGRYLAYDSTALPVGDDGYRNGCKIDYGQMISTDLSGVQILRMVVKNFNTMMFRTNDLDVVSSLSSSSTNSWDYVINNENEIEYGTSSDSFEQFNSTSPVTLYLDVCWGSNASGAFPNTAMAITPDGPYHIGSGTSGRTFFNNPSICAIGYKVRSYSETTQWQGNAASLDLYESGWYTSPSLDAYGENPQNVTLVKRIMVGA